MTTYPTPMYFDRTIRQDAEVLECDDCGALVWDADKHSEHHDAVKSLLVQLVYVEGVAERAEEVAEGVAVFVGYDETDGGEEA